MSLGSPNVYEDTCVDQFDRPIQRQNAIPMPEYHIHRTESETQLFEDMAIAEYREKCMFNRLITGIRQRQQLHFDSQQHQQYPRELRPLERSQSSRGGIRDQVGYNSNCMYPPSSLDAQNQLPHPSHVQVPAVEDMPRQLLLMPKLTERAIEGIISTRCQSLIKASDPPSSTITPFDSDADDHFRSKLTRSSEWSIEGFDVESIQSPHQKMTVAHIISGNDEAFSSTLHNDQVFDMDL